MAYSDKLYSWYSEVTPCLKQYKWEQNVDLLSFTYYFNKSTFNKHLRTHKIRTQTLILALGIALLINLISGKNLKSVGITYNLALAAVNAIELK